MFADGPPSSGRAYESLGGIGLTMLSGFNTNFRYRGVLFHVQTEDSGRANPHVITHLFHGGNIIASEKQEYSALLGDADIETAVRKMMEGQHKAILKQLSRGGHDQAICERLGPDIFRQELDSGTDSVLAPSASEERLPPDATTFAPRGASRIPPKPSKPTRPPEPLEPTIVVEERPSSPATPAASDLTPVFGDRVVSEKPLDEVVLDYLVENARKRRRQPK